MLKSFFVAFNRSPHALAALEYACFLAEQTKGRIHIGHVVELAHEPVISAGMLGGTIETMAVIPPVEAVQEIEAFRRESTAHAEELFSQARAVCERWGVSCETRCLTGYVEEEIAQQARSVDLVAMGQAGGSGGAPSSEIPAKAGTPEQKGRRISPLTEAVVRASPAPVLIATNPYTRVSDVLVIYDGSDCAMHALHHGAEIARQAGLNLTLITAPGSREETDTVHQRACSYLADYDLGFASVVVEPHPEADRELTARVAECPAALLLIGCFGESRLKSWLVGHSSRPIIEHTHNPAIIFKRG